MKHVCKIIIIIIIILLFLFLFSASCGMLNQHIHAYSTALEKQALVCGRTVNYAVKQCCDDGKASMKEVRLPTKRPHFRSVMCATGFDESCEDWNEKLAACAFMVDDIVTKGIISTVTPVPNYINSHTQNCKKTNSCVIFFSLRFYCHCPYVYIYMFDFDVYK
jgi:hypothetical protein